MAVHVYKNGKHELINPESLHSYLESGWSLDGKPAEPEKQKAPKKRKTKQKESE